MAREQMKQDTEKKQRMGRADVAAYFDRSLPWVDKAWRKGLIPPPIQIGSPIWIKASLDQWIEKLQQEAIDAVQKKTA